jgi:hypothetical protein
MVLVKGYQMKMLPSDSHSVFASSNQKMHVGGFFCDLAKTFDGVKL